MNGLQHNTELVLGLLTVMALLVTAARRLHLPYPILLVIGGLVISLLPRLPQVTMAPEIIFLLFGR